MSSMDVGNPETWWDKYGILGIAVFVFAGTIMYLFRLLTTAQNARVLQCDSEKKERIAEREGWILERSKFEIERQSWELERETMRAGFESKHRDVAEKFGREIRELNKDALDREDAVRREFADLMESVSQRAEKTSEANVAVLNKLYDRFVGPRRRGG